MGSSKMKMTHFYQSKDPFWHPVLESTKLYKVELRTSKKGRRNIMTKIGDLFVDKPKFNPLDFTSLSQKVLGKLRRADR